MILVLMSLGLFECYRAEKFAGEAIAWREAAATASFHPAGDALGQVQVVRNPDQLKIAIGQYRANAGESGYRQGF